MSPLFLYRRKADLSLIREIGAASTVLLKNVNHTLPLKKPKSIGLFGSDMGPSSRGPNGFTDRGGDEGTLAMGWGSGTAQFPYLIDPLSAISHQAELDRTDLDWWFRDWDLSSNPGIESIALGSEVCIVGINSDSGEQYITVDGNEGDRNNLTAWHNGNNLILEVAQYSSNVVVVVHSVGPLIIEDWIEHPNVTAVLWAGLPGQESGNSLVDVLYGWYNPSGRLPYTIAKQESDYSAQINYVNTSIPAEPQVNYTEGLYIDYRHFLAQNITPRFEFGFGLSYSEFNFTNLEIWDIDYNKREVEEDQWLEEYYEDSAWDGNNVTMAGRNDTKVGSFLRKSYVPSSSAHGAYANGQAAKAQMDRHCGHSECRRSVRMRSPPTLSLVPHQRGRTAQGPSRFRKSHIGALASRKSVFQPFKLRCVDLGRCGAKVDDSRGGVQCHRR